ncbi:MAG: 50S ribosomal protein L28 [Candidatus Omnitrophica bacterium]|nr:50S ribosomal protein L28 [Candidatus Omnitrophota bacterium]
MAKSCEICGKTSIAGRKYKRRGMAVRKGGAGQKIVGKSPRRFSPNLQSVKIVLKNSTKRTSVCTKCIKAGKITKAA